MTHAPQPPPTKSLFTRDGAWLAAAPLEHGSGQRLGCRQKAALLIPCCSLNSGGREAT